MTGEDGVAHTASATDGTKPVELTGIGPTGVILIVVEQTGVTLIGVMEQMGMTLIGVELTDETLLGMELTDMAVMGVVQHISEEDTGHPERELLDT